jgi:DNA-directed RNA polymerase specialized sigma24 family protein
MHHVVRRRVPAQHHSDVESAAAVVLWRRHGDIEALSTGEARRFVRGVVGNVWCNVHRHEAAQQRLLADPLVRHSGVARDPSAKTEAAALLNVALCSLDDADVELMIGRFELGYSYDELATKFGFTSAAAVRQRVSRARNRAMAEVSRFLVTIEA